MCMLCVHAHMCMPRLLRLALCTCVCAHAWTQMHAHTHISAHAYAHTRVHARRKRIIKVYMSIMQYVIIIMLWGWPTQLSVYSNCEC